MENMICIIALSTLIFKRINECVRMSLSVFNDIFDIEYSWAMMKKCAFDIKKKQMEGATNRH